MAKVDDFIKCKVRLELVDTAIIVGTIESIDEQEQSLILSKVKLCIPTPPKGSKKQQIEELDELTVLGQDVVSIEIVSSSPASKIEHEQGSLGPPVKSYDKGTLSMSKPKESVVRSNQSSFSAENSFGRKEKLAGEQSLRKGKVARAQVVKNERRPPSDPDNFVRPRILQRTHDWVGQDISLIKRTDFDFEANLGLFDKGKIFADIKAQDETKLEDRLISHNRKNIPHNENILSEGEEEGDGGRDGGRDGSGDGDEEEEEETINIKQTIFTDPVNISSECTFTTKQGTVIPAITEYEWQQLLANCNISQENLLGQAAMAVCSFIEDREIAKLPRRSVQSVHEYRSKISIVILAGNHFWGSLAVLVATILSGRGYAVFLYSKLGGGNDLLHRLKGLTQLDQQISCKGKFNGLIVLDGLRGFGQDNQMVEKKEKDCLQQFILSQRPTALMFLEQPIINYQHFYTGRTTALALVLPKVIDTDTTNGRSKKEKQEREEMIQLDIGIGPLTLSKILSPHKGALSFDLQNWRVLLRQSV